MTEGLEHSLNVPQQIDQKGAALCNHPLHHSSLKPRNHRTPDLLHSQSFTVWATACKYFSPNCLLCPLRTTSWPGPPVVTAERWADLHTHTTRTPTATAASSSTPKGMNRIRTARVQAAHRLSEGEWKATNGADVCELSNGLSVHPLLRSVGLILLLKSSCEALSLWNS